MKDSKIRTEIVWKVYEHEEPQVEIGDIVYWTAQEKEPCLVCYGVLVNLANPWMTWSFSTKTHESFIRELKRLIAEGKIKKMTGIEKIVIYPEGEEVKKDER